MDPAGGGDPVVGAYRSHVDLSLLRDEFGSV